MAVTIRARITLARIAFTKLKLEKAVFGTRRVALEPKKIAYESLILALYGSEWVVNAEDPTLRKCIRIDLCTALVARGAGASELE